jgi:hypothetical protein
MAPLQESLKEIELLAMGGRQTSVNNKPSSTLNKKLEFGSAKPHRVVHFAPCVTGSKGKKA